MLVPHEPDADPRIGWVADLCTPLADTTILAATWSSEPPTRTRREAALVERIFIPDFTATRTTTLRLLRRIKGAVQKLPDADESPEYDATPDNRNRAARRLSVTAAHFSGHWMKFWMVVDALYRRAKAETTIPDLIVCHDLAGLIAGARLKSLWSVPLLYDTHEYWPQANLLHKPWEEALLTRVERRLIRKADQVVTVSPPLAAHRESVFGVGPVLSVPNAAPGQGTRSPSQTPDGSVRFLLQGQLAAGRGLELLLDAWPGVNERAVLQLRYVPNQYSSAIESRYASLLAAGRVEKLMPVSEDNLVEAATESDVGVVPYVGPNLNHLYACPNKVSQYMQAGLALLASSDMLYVGDLLNRFGCGVTYDPRRPETLRGAIDSIVQSPHELARMKRAGAMAAEAEFNWEVVSKPYGEAITRLLGARDEISEGV